MEVFQFHPRKLVIQTWLLNCPQHVFLFHTVFECNPSIHDQGKMLVLLIDFFIEYFPNLINVLFFPANFMSSTYTDKNNLLSRGTNKYSQLETSFPNRVSIGFSQIAFPITVLPNQISLKRSVWKAVDGRQAPSSRSHRIQEVFSDQEKHSCPHRTVGSTLARKRGSTRVEDLELTDNLQ